MHSTCAASSRQVQAQAAANMQHLNQIIVCLPSDCTAKHGCMKKIPMHRHVCFGDAWQYNEINQDISMVDADMRCKAPPAPGIHGVVQFLVRHRIAPRSHVERIGRRPKPRHRRHGCDVQREQGSMRCLRLACMLPGVTQSPSSRVLGLNGVTTDLTGEQWQKDGKQAC